MAEDEESRPRRGGARRTHDRGGDRESVHADPRLGLCPGCRHVKIVASQRGSTFRLCQRSVEDARYAKYPPQPVVSCSGFER